MTTALTNLTQRLAAKLEMGDGSGLVETLKATAFKGPVSDAQMTALMVVANQYALNPWTKEIYAFPDKNNGIVPVVGVDGWSRIINQHPQFDGLEFRQSETMATPKGGKPSPEWMECVIYRKDRMHPIVVREYLDEVYREPFARKGDRGEYTVDGPWQTHTKRFMRHKTMIQCARLAFGYSGIYDQDEAERIVEAKQPTVIDAETGEIVKAKAAAKPALPPYPQESLQKNLDAWSKVVADGRKTVDEIIAMASTKGTLTPEQVAQIKTIGKKPSEPAPADPMAAHEAWIDEMDAGEQA